jgi:hypothetical protein
VEVEYKCLTTMNGMMACLQQDLVESTETVMERVAMDIFIDLWPQNSNGRRSIRINLMAAFGVVFG